MGNLEPSIDLKNVPYTIDRLQFSTFDLVCEENKALVFKNISKGLFGLLHLRVFLELYLDRIDSCGPQTPLKHDAAVLHVVCDECHRLE